MRRFERHRVWAGRAVVLLFVLGNSGFTAVVRSCPALPPACCCAPLCHPGVCDKGAAPAPVPGRLQISSSCLNVHIAGGLSGLQAVVEKSLSQSGSVSRCIPALSESHRPALPAAAGFVRFAVSPIVSPHPVEKYILNATFLI